MSDRGAAGSGDGKELFSYRPDGTVLTWSPEAGRLLGQPPEAVVGRNITEFLSLVGCFHTPDAIMQPDEGASLLYFIRRPDGPPILLNVTVRSVLAPDGTVASYELRLRAPDEDDDPSWTERALTQFLEISPDAAVMVGQDGRIVAMNARIERLSGYSPADLAGKGIETLVPERSRDAHRRQRADFALHSIARPMGTGLDLYLHCKNGSDIPVDISLQPIQLDSRHLVLAAVRDMTARKRAEERFVSLIEDAPDGLIITDSNGVIILANRQTEILFGYDREELLGQLVEILVPEALRSGHRDRRLAYLHAPVPRSMGERPILRGRRKDGTEIPIDIALSPISSEYGVLIMVAVRDASTRERLEQAEQRARDLESSSLIAERANRLKGEFISGLSHELRTPLTAVIGYAELLKGEDGEPYQGDPAPYLGGILSAARHLSRLVTDVLDMTTIEAGKMLYRSEPVDPGAIASDVREVVWPQAQQRGIALSVHVDAGLSDIVTDPGRLRQILMNFLSNAIKFTHPGGRVQLRIGPEGAERFRIEVEDNGPGIAPDDIGRLFVPFERIISGDSRLAPGTGLGLALTKRLVQGLGGEIGVRSERGQGSVFWAVLPRVGPHPVH